MRGRDEGAEIARQNFGCLLRARSQSAYKSNPASFSLSSSQFHTSEAIHRSGADGWSAAFQLQAALLRWPAANRRRWVTKPTLAATSYSTFLPPLPQRADQTTVNVDDDSDDNEKVEGYPIPMDSDEADSDTIGCQSPRVDLDGKPSNKKRKRVTSSPHKKPTKGKANSKSKVRDDEMASSIKRLADSLVAPPVPVQPVPPPDPYANLWKRINALPFTAKDKLEIAAHLSKPDQDVFRSYLNQADDALLSEWVITYFERQDGGGNVVPFFPKLSEVH
ncbi:hypothetical protein BRADI_3g36851v3 [Brachypodium distachyon]|uniref:Uncharacterized protein n=1 Tax=Brachypodium distachyon TaxID=15368 RepID=A0A2K2D1M4_BRADI|nr:hypothetical protein BRADI_3g36851v3 [Brachypodium distachyon]